MKPVYGSDLMMALGIDPDAANLDEVEVDGVIKRAKIKVQIAKAELKIQQLQSEIDDLRRAYRRARTKGAD